MKLFLVAFALLSAVQFTAVHAIPHQLFKREKTEFGQCPPNDKGVQAPLLTVSVVPDPIVSGHSETFTYSGPIDKDITSTTLVGVRYLDQNEKLLASPCKYHICKDKGCPIKAGTKFTKTADCPAPNKLPATYFVGVRIINSETEEVYACGRAKIGS
jgi:hypothetical protein